MIPNKEKEGWHYLAVKKLLALSIGIMSKHPILLQQKANLNFLKKYVKRKFYGIVLPTQKDNTLEFNQHMKLHEIWYIIYPDIERFIKKNR